jgi:hypothetical protein
LFELFGDVAYSGPILRDFLLLSAHLDEELPGEYPLIAGGSDEIDRVDFCLEDDFE